MGENEQGGMLRTVIVLGLIAIIAGAVIFAVTQLTIMNKTTQQSVLTAVVAATEVVDDAATSNYTYSYDVTTKTAVLTGMKDASVVLGKAVVIPAKVSYNGDLYTMDTIGSKVFASKGITGLTLPNTLIRINQSAFRDNVYLTTVTLPKSLKVIEYNAFYKDGLTELVLPTGLTTVESNAFSLNNLTLGSVHGSLIIDPSQTPFGLDGGVAITPVS